MIICDKISGCRHVIVNAIYVLGTHSNDLEQMCSQSDIPISMKIVKITLLGNGAVVIKQHSPDVYYKLQALLDWITVQSALKKIVLHIIFDNLPRIHKIHSGRVLDNYKNDTPGSGCIEVEHKSMN